MKEKQVIGWMLLLLGGMGLCAGCSVSVPAESAAADRLPEIYPDYRQITIPPNIAPMNFDIQETGDDADSYITEVAGENGEKRLFSGKTVCMPVQFWHALLEANQGKTITLTVYVRRNGTWQKYQPIVNAVSADRIDPWLTYRRIEPGYANYGRIRLEERCLENFQTKTFYDNTSLGRGCANCHHCQNNNPERSLFHVRQKFGGTMLRWDGELKKIDTKSDRSGFAMSYPAWHPTLPLIAYSSNNTRQLFHAHDLKKIEVFDTFSDLMLYDIKKQAIIPILETEHEFETFPVWQRDGRALFYCVAKLETSEKESANRKEAAEARQEEMITRNEEIRYSLMKMSYDPDTGKFGAPEVVLDADAEQKSFVHPRISPDGRFMVYVQLNFGTFPLTHTEGDLWLYDLTTGQRRPMTEINSDNAESFHSWDSSGRWMVFSTRRENGAFTRSYFTHFNPDGTCTKPFLLPPKTPQTEREDRYSHNLPEMITGPVPLDGGAMSRKIRYSEAEKSQTLPPSVPGR